MARLMFHRLALVSFGAACAGLILNIAVALLHKQSAAAFPTVATASPGIQLALVVVTILAGVFAFFRFYKPGTDAAGPRVSDLVLVGAALALALQNAFVASRWASQAEAARAEQHGSLAPLRERAEAGDPEAQHDLGVHYDQGLGIDQDQAEAVRWYRRAAERGFAPAQYNLAYSLEAGEGVARDIDGAVRWYTKAAEQGLQPAQVAAGVLHLDPASGGENPPAAYMWLTLAAEGEPGDAQVQAQHYLDQVKARLTPEQRVEGERLLSTRRGRD
jgi:hypothetical protein